MVSKTFLKTVLSMICVLTLVVGSVYYVSANQNDIMFDLSSLGVLKDLEINKDINANITRAEFSQLVVNLLGYNNVAGSFEDLGVFTDISDSKYNGSINLLYDLNIISGTGKNVFSPNMSLTYQQVGKFMVNILGYSKIVKNTDLSSYYMLAGSIGVYTNVDSTKPYVTWYDALVIAHNAMNIDLMTKDFGMIGDNYLIQEGKTLRTSLSTTTGRNVKKLKGVVTADRTTYLLEARSNMKATQVEVNGKLYKCNFTVPDGLVGMEVNFYIDYTDDLDGIVTSIAPTDKNFVVEFNLEDFGSVLPGKIEYWVNDAKKATIKVNDYAKYIYNGRWDRKASYTDIVNCKNGYVKLIDNDEDEVIDIAFVYEFDDAIVERKYDETKQVYFANNQLVYGARFVSFNEKEDKTIVKISDASGNPVSYEDIEKNNIISLAKSKDGQVIYAVISKKIVTGVVNEFDEYSVVIGTDVFDYTVKPNVKLGTHVDAYVNFLGKVFYVEKTKTDNMYAYVFDAKSESGISDTVRVALIKPGYISETSTESFDDNGTADSTKELFFRNNAKVIYELASKVRVDDITTKASNAISLIKGKVVSYGLDANNKINKITVLDVFNGDSTDKTYNQNGKTFSSKAVEGFGITESETMSICIPTNEGTSDDDLLVPVKLVHGSPYSINAYDVDENSSIAGLAVIKAEMRSGVAGSISPKTSDIAILKKASKVLDENGNETLRVNMLTKQGEKSYKVSPLMSSTVYNRFAGMNKGDIFFYETIEGTEELRNCQLLQAENNYDVTGAYNVGQINEICIGKVADCRYNYVSAKYNRWTDSVSIDCGDSSGLVSYEIFKTGTPVIFVIDEAGNSKPGNFEDIQCGNTIYVGSVYSNVRVLAVRK